MRNQVVMSRELQEETQREWRELGFYFNYDEATRRWLFIGSRNGLRNFCKLLLNYAADPKHQQISEHEHYGPYMDLKFMTWSVPEIRDDGLYGRPHDFARLAKHIEEALLSGQVPAFPGSVFLEQSGSVAVDLETRLVADDFDPASADTALVEPQTQ